MNHSIDTVNGSCRLCGATRAQFDDNLVTPECLGPVGHQLRLQGIAEMFKLQNPMPAGATAGAEEGKDG